MMDLLRKLYEVQLIEVFSDPSPYEMFSMHV